MSADAAKPKTPCMPYLIPTELTNVYINATKPYIIQTGNTDITDSP